MLLAAQLRWLQIAEQQCAAALRAVGDGHRDEVDIAHTTDALAQQCEAHARELAPFVERYADESSEMPDEAPRAGLFGGVRSGPLGLLRDLNDLYLMACECELAWTLIGQAAQGARDRDLIDLAGSCDGESAIQVRWLRTRMKQAAPQTLVVA